MLIGASLKQFDDSSERQSFLLLFNFFIAFITSCLDTEHSLIVSTCGLLSGLPVFTHNGKFTISHVHALYNDEIATFEPLLLAGMQLLMDTLLININCCWTIGVKEVF